MSTQLTFFPPSNQPDFSPKHGAQIFDISINFIKRSVFAQSGGAAQRLIVFPIFGTGRQAGADAEVSAGLSSGGSKEAGSDMSLMRRLFMAAAALGFTLNAGAATIPLLHTSWCIA